MSLFYRKFTILNQMMFLMTQYLHKHPNGPVIVTVKIDRSERYSPKESRHQELKHFQTNLTQK